MKILALVAISSMFGLERPDRSEVAVFSIDRLSLIINGILLSRVLRRQAKSEARS